MTRLYWQRGQPLMPLGWRVLSGLLHFAEGIVLLVGCALNRFPRWQRGLSRDSWDSSPADSLFLWWYDRHREVIAKAYKEGRLR